MKRKTFSFLICREAQADVKSRISFPSRLSLSAALGLRGADEAISSSQTKRKARSQRPRPLGCRNLRLRKNIRNPCALSEISGSGRRCRYALTTFPFQGISALYGACTLHVTELMRQLCNKKTVDEFFVFFPLY